MIRKVMRTNYAGECCRRADTGFVISQTQFLPFHVAGGGDPLLDVLVASGCYNRVPQTGQLRSNRNSLLTVLGAEQPKIKAKTR